VRHTRRLRKPQQERYSFKENKHGLRACCSISQNGNLESGKSHCNFECELAFKWVLQLPLLWIDAVNRSRSVFCTFSSQLRIEQPNPSSQSCSLHGLDFSLLALVNNRGRSIVSRNSEKDLAFHSIDIFVGFLIAFLALMCILRRQGSLTREEPSLDESGWSRQ